MPGSIHVSVIDFSGLPSSSPSSSILIKASMGKSHHQVWGKGDFSLPLTNLRDNVIITLHDADGNEVSHTGVRIVSIVEKGSLDESLSLKGGGIVHLKLRFVLNDEERNRIQRMRESAMKRKRDELLSISPRYSKFANTASGTVPLPSSWDNHEVADSRASVSQNEVLKIGDQAIQSPKGNEAHTKEIIPYEANVGDGSKGMQLLNNENQNRSDDKIKIREENSTLLVDGKEKDKDQIDVSYTSVMKEDSSGDKIETSIEQTTRLVNKNEMDQIYISNPSVTKDDSIDKKFVNRLNTEEKYGELAEKNVEEIPQINAPTTIPKISKVGLSYSSAYLATPEMNNVEDPLEKTPNNERKMNRTDESEDGSPLVSLLQGVDVCDENLDEKNENIKDIEEYQSRLEVQNETKLYPSNFPQRSKNSEEASSNLEKDLTLLEVKKQGAVRIEKREPLQKTSSSVRKMISAFESSQLKETRPVIKPPPTKTEKVGLKAPKGLVSKDHTKPTRVLSSKVYTPLVDENLELNETDRTIVEERNVSSFSEDASHFQDPSLLQTQAKEGEERTTDNSKPTNLLMCEMKTPLVDEKSKPIETNVMKTKERIGDNFYRDACPLEEPSMLQTQVEETEQIMKNDKNSVRMFLVEEEPSMLQTYFKETEDMTKKGSDLVKMFKVKEQHKRHSLNLLVPQQGVRDTADIGIPESEIPSSNSREDNIGNSLENGTKTIDSWEHESYSGETSSAWIFPEDKTLVCISTDTKQVKDLVGTCHIEERLFLSENVKQDIRKSGVYTDMNESGKKKSSNESRPGAETSSGPFGQAIKIALMVAFGSLILFTRQRNPR